MNYTSIEQSKKLLELGLSPESADMCYVIDYAESNKYGKDQFNLQVDIYGFLTQRNDNIPCWSVEALLEVMPKEITTDKGIYSFTIKWDGDIEMVYYVNREHKTLRFQNTNSKYHVSPDSYDLVDALVQMYEWLLENNYIKND